MMELVGAGRATTCIAPSPSPTIPVPTPIVPARPSASARELFEDFLGVLALSRVAERTHIFPWLDLRGVIELVCAADDASDELFWVGHDMVARAGMEHITVHQARVAVLAVRLGSRAGYDLERRIALGMAGALIDVGLWRVRDDVVRRAESPSPQEAELLQTHPRVSAEMVASWAPPLPGLVEAIAQHHERADGTGVPDGVRADEIRLDAQILGLVDCYAEWTSLAVEGRRHRPHEVVRELMRWRHGPFTPALVKALLSEVTVFPPGSIVSLTTGEVGRVTRVNRRHPLRPSVEIIAAPHGERGHGHRTIDLAEMPLIAIASLVESTAS